MSDRNQQALLQNTIAQTERLEKSQPVEGTNLVLSTDEEEMKLYWSENFRG